MPRFEPFAALRYDLDRHPVQDVTAPPYDVLSDADRAELIARSDRNAVLIDLPAESDGPGRYDQAGTTLRGWVADGTLLRDGAPTFTAYRMRTLDDTGAPTSTLGVIGALELSRPDEGQILPHEHTTPKAKSDRLDLLRGTSANLSAIWGLSLTQGLTELLGVADREPDHTWDDPDGVGHDVWVLEDPTVIAAVSAAVAASPLVIADGHHRYETSLAYRDERRAVDGTGGPADSTLCYVVELTESQLAVRPIHRLVHGLDPDAVVAVLTAHPGFTEGDTVSAAEVADGAVLAAMESHGAIAVVAADGTARLLTVDPSAFDEGVDLDSARLVAGLAAAADHELTYQHGTDRVQEALADGRATAGVLIGPVTVSAIEANAHTGERMPPKSTFFHPKPRTGIVFREM